MVPSGWFPEAAAPAAGTDIDLGIHLTLTSESARFRRRTAEYDLFRDPEFTASARSLLVELGGMRRHRDQVRTRS